MPACGVNNFNSMKDNFSKQAARYATYRPVYPTALYEFILEQIQHRQLAWDCGTGNGQCAIELSRYFEKVYATDISQKQIDHAPKADNIFYSVQPAESTHFPDSAFDLITVAQALHWFKFEAFYKEVTRVAKNGCIFTAWSYSLLNITPEIDELIKDYHFNTMHDYWDAERKYVDDGYSTLPFPFDHIDTPRFHISYQWTMRDLEGYLNTWSALQKFIEVNGYNPVPQLMSRINGFWRTGTMNINFPVHMLMTRIQK